VSESVRGSLFSEDFAAWRDAANGWAERAENAEQERDESRIALAAVTHEKDEARIRVWALEEALGWIIARHEDCPTPRSRDTISRAVAALGKASE
jgi:hypothetical protein